MKINEIILEDFDVGEFGKQVGKWVDHTKTLKTSPVPKKGKITHVGNVIKNKNVSGTPIVPTNNPKIKMPPGGFPKSNKNVPDTPIVPKDQSGTIVVTKNPIKGPALDKDGNPNQAYKDKYIKGDDGLTKNQRDKAAKDKLADKFKVHVGF
jgi:hypothetical protein